MKTELIRRNYLTIVGVCFLYAIFYTFCRYENPAGITTPLCVLGSIGMIYYIFKMFDWSFSKKAIAYLVPIIALSISTIMTDDGTLHFFNGVGSFLLFICLILNEIYKDNHWGFVASVKSISFLVSGSTCHFYRVFEDLICWNKEKEKGKYQGIIYAGIGLIVSFPLLFIIGLLLMSSDAIILDFVVTLMEEINFFDIVCIIVSIVFIFFAAYGCIAYLGKKSITVVEKSHRILHPAILMGITGLLSIMYVFYSVIQIISLFWGKMQLPAGYTYAKYAREGFFQLLVVCAFNLILILVAITFVQKSKILNAILVCISLCTYIMLISSGIRMIMYIRFYYMSYLRILVLWALFFIFLLLTGAVIAIFKEKFPLFSYAMIVVTLCYFILAFGKPDYWIAKINCDNIGEVQSEFFLGDSYDDYYYLSTLSLDAYSIVKPVLEEYVAEGYWYCDWEEEKNKKIEEMGIRNFNFAVESSKER